MTGAWIALVIIVGGGLLLLLMVGMGIYNSLVALRERYKNAFSQIEVQFKRRYDLIPNLVETAKAYMKHESETLENVIKARNAAFGAMQAASAPRDTRGFFPTCIDNTLNNFSRIPRKGKWRNPSSIRLF